MVRLPMGMAGSLQVPALNSDLCAVAQDAPVLAPKAQEQAVQNRVAITIQGHHSDQLQAPLPKQ